jgi:hypothetical protein
MADQHGFEESPEIRGWGQCTVARQLLGFEPRPPAQDAPTVHGTP